MEAADFHIRRNTELPTIVIFMLSCTGLFSNTALNNMRALILILLVCCVLFEHVSGLKSPTKTVGSGLPKFQESEGLGAFDSRKEMLEIRGGKDVSKMEKLVTCSYLHLERVSVRHAPHPSKDLTNQTILQTHSHKSPV